MPRSSAEYLDSLPHTTFLSSSYLQAVSEVCDADDPGTVECADAIADYLDVAITEAVQRQDNANDNGQQQQQQQAAALGTGSAQHSYMYSPAAQDTSAFDSSSNENVNQQTSAPIAQPITSTTATSTSAISSNDQNMMYAQSQQQQTRGESTKPTDQEMEDRFLKMVSTEIDVKNLIGENPYAITDIPVGVIVGRILDSLEDIGQKNNGKFKGQSRLRWSDTPAEERPTVVVLGTGWGAHAFIKAASTYDLRIVVVSPVNHFVSKKILACIYGVCALFLRAACRLIPDTSS